MWVKRLWITGREPSWLLLPCQAAAPVRGCGEHSPILAPCPELGPVTAQAWPQGEGDWAVLVIPLHPRDYR